MFSFSFYRKEKLRKTCVFYKTSVLNKYVARIRVSTVVPFLSCTPNTQQKSSRSSKIANQSVAEQKRVARKSEFRFLNTYHIAVSEDCFYSK